MWCQLCRRWRADYWDRLNDRALCPHCVNRGDPMELFWLEYLDPATQRRLQARDDDISNHPDYWFGDDRW
jgi:hypothetical protein